MSKRMAALRQAQVEAEGLRPVYVHERKALTRVSPTSPWRLVSATPETVKRRLDAGHEVVIQPTGGVTVCYLQRNDEDGNPVNVAQGYFAFSAKAYDLFDARGNRVETRHKYRNFDRALGRKASYGRAVKAYLAKQQPVSA